MSTGASSIIQDVQSWSGWVGGILSALAGKASTAPATSTAAKTPSAASPGASLSLGISSDVGQVAGTITALTNLIAARSALNNSAPMVKAAEAQKIQDLKDAAAQAIAHAEATGDLAPIRLLLS